MNEITLAEIFGVLPENLICYQNADGTFFADSRAEPKLSDTVLCRFDDDFSIKAFSDVAPPVSPVAPRCPKRRANRNARYFSFI